MSLRPIEVDMSVEESPILALGVEETQTYSMQVSEAIVSSTSPEYEGDYEITPTQEEQVLDTADRHLSQEIHIAAIPSNYGLITWNGSILTVS